MLASFHQPFMEGEGRRGFSKIGVSGGIKRFHIKTPLEARLYLVTQSHYKSLGDSCIENIENTEVNIS